MHAVTRLDGQAMWTEIARPQIHGYDMTDAAFISPYRFASTGDEKVTRVFDAPGGFVESLQSLGVSSSSLDAVRAFLGDSCSRRETRADVQSSRPKGATVPPLGLSNRALGRGEEKHRSLRYRCQLTDVSAAEVSDLPTPHVGNPAVDSVSVAFSSLPTEEELATTTLWPEVEKVYGHGYEVSLHLVLDIDQTVSDPLQLVTLAASHDGRLIATACRASNTEHAVVRVVSTETWDLVGEPLSGHTLSITRIAFSPDDSRILTCSRDRSWRVYGRKPDQTEGRQY